MRKLLNLFCPDFVCGLAFANLCLPLLTFAFIFVYMFIPSFVLLVIRLCLALLGLLSIFFFYFHTDSFSLFFYVLIKKLRGYIYLDVMKEAEQCSAKHSFYDPCSLSGVFSSDTSGGLGIMSN